MTTTRMFAPTLVVMPRITELSELAEPGYLAVIVIMYDQNGDRLMLVMHPKVARDLRDKLQTTPPQSGGGIRKSDSD